MEKCQLKLDKRIGERVLVARGQRRALLKQERALSGPITEVRLEVAGLCVSLVSNDDEFMGLVEKEYRKFISVKKSRTIIDLHFEEMDIWEDPSPAPILSFLNGRIEAIHRDFVALLTMDYRHMKVVQPKRLGSIENILRFIYSFLIVDHNGFLLHAAGVKRGQDGYVFFGKSGSGKTTVAKLSTDYTILSDDLLAIKRVNGCYQVFATPFGGEVKDKREAVSAEIRGLFLLRKDQTVYFHRLSHSEAIAKLLSNVVSFTLRSEQVTKLFNLSWDLSSATPCYEMHFLPDKSFWRCMNEYLYGYVCG